LLFLAADLNLRINIFSGEIPSSIGQLPRTLTNLDISANGITGILPTEIGLLTELEELRIARSDFAVVPDGFCSDAVANPGGCLTGSIPTEIGLLTKLRILWLFEHSMTGALPTELGNLAQLSELLIYTNSFSGEVPDTFANLQNLGKWLIDPTKELHSRQVTKKAPDRDQGMLTYPQIFLDPRCHPSFSSRCHPYSYFRWGSMVLLMYSRIPSIYPISAYSAFGT
jgi:Leucine-rich repeat (LRR) protein